MKQNERINDYRRYHKTKTMMRMTNYREKAGTAVPVLDGMCASSLKWEAGEKLPAYHCIQFNVDSENSGHLSHIT